ncbi:MAG: hypothetical protein JW808_03375 [Victivallales bacterium]|nr:hypothetical protein [Victivallales bacterium]
MSKEPISKPPVAACLCGASRQAWHAICLAFFFSACAGIKTERREVFFAEPKTVLGYKTVEPDKLESEGLRLRVYRQDKLLEFNDTLTVFTRVEDGKGDAVEFNKHRKVLHSPGRSIDDFLVTTETTCDQLSEKSTEQIFMSNRGELLEFIEGEYKSRKGNIRILSWERDPVFPEEPVKVGDEWAYNEKMQIELQSFWITRNVEGPESIKVNCRLAGFVDYQGRRCALIQTKTLDNRDENYTAMFKTMKLNIRSVVSQTLLLDYKRGIFPASITDTKSFSSCGEHQFFDSSTSRTLSLLKE